MVLSAHGVAPEVYRNARGARPAGDRRHLPAGDQGAQRGAAVRRRRLHDLPGRARRPRGGRRHDGRGARGDPARRVASRTSTRLHSADPERVAYITQTTLSVDETTDDHRGAAAALPGDRRAAQGRHLLRHAEPPDRRQVACARGRPGAGDRLRELLELQPPGRRDARARRAGAPDRRRDATSTRPGSTGVETVGITPAHRRPSGWSSGSSTASAAAASPTSPSTT